MSILPSTTWPPPEVKRDNERRAHLARVGVNVNDVFRRHLNQADRPCSVFAVNGTQYAFEYEMPRGAIYIRIGDTETGVERSVSRTRLPKWARDAAPEDTKGGAW